MRSIEREAVTGARGIHSRPAAVAQPWIWAMAILLLAIAVRLLFFSGAIGSDELVYTTAAARVMAWDWAPSTYVGAIRYGINIPLGLWLSLVGYGNLGLGGLYFLCSIGEVALAFLFARHLWGDRAALWAAAIMALLPLNVALAGSLNPDAYLALIIELSFVTFYLAQKTDSYGLYFLTGLLAGWVFWIKEVVVIYGFVFLLLAAAERRWSPGWLWLIFGGSILVAADLIFFWRLYGDPLYQLHILGSTVANVYIAGDAADASVTPYLTYLFLKVYHTGLLGWLALAGCIAALRRRVDPDLRFVMIWAGGLLLVFSVLPISLSPLKFIAKQSNYMAIFIFPLALLAGWFIARQSHAVRLILGAAFAGSSLLLAAMEEQTTRSLTANGPTAIAFATAHSGLPVFGAETVERQSVLDRLMHGSVDSPGVILPLTELRKLPASDGPPDEIVAYAIEDPQAAYWSAARGSQKLIEQVRTCASGRETIPIPDDLGAGHWVVGVVYNAASLFPTAVADRVHGILDPLYTVAPAAAYAIPRECAARLAA